MALRICARSCANRCNGTVGYQNCPNASTWRLIRCYGGGVLVRALPLACRLLSMTAGARPGRVAAVRIADRELSRDAALGIVRDYAARHDATVLLYDLAGDEDACPGPGGAAEPVDAVTLADIGRLVVINAGLRSGDVPLLLDVRPDKEFADVPWPLRVAASQTRPQREQGWARDLATQLRQSHRPPIGRCSLMTRLQFGHGGRARPGPPRPALSARQRRCAG